jgi:hypothetical protein
MDMGFRYDKIKIERWVEHPGSYIRPLLCSGPAVSPRASGGVFFALLRIVIFLRDCANDACHDSHLGFRQNGPGPRLISDLFALHFFLNTAALHEHDIALAIRRIDREAAAVAGLGQA